MTPTFHPLVIAHRGACRYAPENTLAAFRLAADQGAPAIELDAKLSADGAVVVIHDATVDRTTNGSGAVASLSLSRLKSLEAGAFFGPQFAGEPVPTLEEVFDALGARLLINVELTNYANPADRLVEKTVDLVRAFHLEERILFSSFHPVNLFTARRLLPEVPRAILALPGRKGWWARSFLLRGIAPQAVNPYFTDVAAPFVQRQHQAGRKVNVWTLNDPADLERLTLAGVDGLITDDPPAAFSAIVKTSDLLSISPASPHPAAW
jgi:glycerophosphoryl diester phosphodiesterase